MKFSLKSAIRWSMMISLVTLIVACIFMIVSDSLVRGWAWGHGMLVVLILIIIGIFFDMIGLASAAANEKPFHAMASEKVKGSKQAIGIIRNADRFSSFCNDVVGDVTGVISGVASALVITKLMLEFSAQGTLIEKSVTVLFTGVVAALTVGGKSMGKSFGIHYSTEIILVVGKVFYFLEHRLGIKLFNNKNNGKKNQSNGKRGNKRASRADQSTQ